MQVSSVERDGVDFDHMTIRINDVDLRVTGRRFGLDLHLVEIARVGIFAVAFGSQEFHGSPVAGNAHGKMHVTRIDALPWGAEGGVIMNDKMQMLAVADLKPCARKGKWRPGDFLQTEDIAVELLRALDIGDRESDVVKESDFHDENSLRLHLHQHFTRVLAL